MTSKLDISTATDEVLVKAAQKGDMAAFEELVARHRDKIYARAFSMMRNEDEAVDLSQEAWKHPDRNAALCHWHRMPGKHHSGPTAEYR